MLAGAAMTCHRLALRLSHQWWHEETGEPCFPLILTDLAIFPKSFGLRGRSRGPWASGGQQHRILASAGVFPVSSRWWLACKKQIRLSSGGALHRARGPSDIIRIYVTFPSIMVAELLHGPEAVDDHELRGVILAEAFLVHRPGSAISQALWREFDIAPSLDRNDRNHGESLGKK